jgi:hypothetical protein
MAYWGLAKVIMSGLNQYATDRAERYLATYFILICLFGRPAQHKINIMALTGAELTNSLLIVTIRPVVVL